MQIFYRLIFRILVQFTFLIYMSYAWVKMSFVILSWMQADFLLIVLIGVALVGSMYLFQHLLLESRLHLRAPSEFTLQEALRALAIAAGFAVVPVVFVCAVFPMNLGIEITGLKDVLFLSMLSFWFLLPLIAYAAMYVCEQNRVLGTVAKSRA